MIGGPAPARRNVPLLLFKAVPLKPFIHRAREATWALSRRPRTGAPLLLGLGMAVLTGCATQAPVTAPVAAVPAPPAEEAPKPWVEVDPAAYYHFIRGHQLELNRQYDRALPEYLAALKYAPDDKEILSRTASLYLKNGDVGRAISTTGRWRCSWRDLP